MISIMRACKEAGTVRRIVFTSSAGTCNIEEWRKPVYDEDNWTDVDFCRRVKMTGWVRTTHVVATSLLVGHAYIYGQPMHGDGADDLCMHVHPAGRQMYFVSKTLAEKAALAYAAEHGMELVTIITTLVVGPFLSTGMPPSMITALALVTGNEAHYSILKQVQFVHLDDLCDAHIFLFEHPAAAGRYVCSSCDTTIHDLAAMLRDRYPEYDIPERFPAGTGIEDDLQMVHMSAKKLQDLGFTFRYTRMEDMYDDAIRTCREKGLIPLAAAGRDDGSASVRAPGERDVTATAGGDVVSAPVRAPGGETDVTIGA
jgi:bifunctional dihydroflavonol 4-reductase/flavanone 4-reductase